MSGGETQDDSRIKAKSVMQRAREAGIASRKDFRCLFPSQSADALEFRVVHSQSMQTKTQDFFILLTKDVKCTNQSASKNW